MGVGPADAAAAVPGPDFFETVPDDLLVQIIQTTLTQAVVKYNPTLCQFGNTFNHLRATCSRFRAMLNNPEIGEYFLIEALKAATIGPNLALQEIAQLGQPAWLIPLLVRAGANVNAQAIIGTVLHVAVSNGHLPVVQELISAGADVNARDDRGWTPLQRVEHSVYLGYPGYDDIIKVLKKAQKRDCCSCCSIQ